MWCKKQVDDGKGVCAENYWSNGNFLKPTEHNFSLPAAGPLA